ncbi:aryl-sulfate sulfotransferase [Candidatus Marinimicrobia bacterium]|nr:aryl-sulfate sulfotransferase [Candidatus Neomarinimicrobiota bacterium]
MKLVLLLTTTIILAMPEFNVIRNTDPFSGKIFIHSMSHYMSILDEDLNFYWIINNANKGMDFKVNNSKLTFHHRPTETLNQSFWIIADQTMTEIDSVQCTQGLTDFHDIIITDNDSYILQSYDSKVMDLTNFGASQFEVVRDILRIQEFDFDHNLIFNWDASEHLDFNDYAHFILSTNSNDIIWMHGNSIDVDYDNNLILSNRRSSEIIKINRITGDIIWIMGGPMNEFQILDDPNDGVKYQHDVTRLENGNLLVFDNRTFTNNLQTNNISRVAEYELDEINKTARLVWQFQNPYDYTSRAMGSAQRLANGNTFINWGQIHVEGQSIGASIMEVNYEKHILLELEFENHQSYKVTKNDFEFSIPMVIGDINLDDTLNVQDVIYAVNYVLSNNLNHSIFNLYKIDTNLDYAINIIDIIDIVSRVLE